MFNRIRNQLSRLSTMHNLFMKSFVCFTCAVLASLSAQSPAMAIVGGTDVNPAGNRPYQVYIQYISEGKPWMCGGSLVHERWVLTAAHCMKGASNVTITAGIHNIDSPEPGSQKIPAKRYIIYEDYQDQGPPKHDIALVELERSVKLGMSIGGIIVDLIALSERTNLQGIEGIATGWGLTSYDGATSSTLKEVELPVISGLICRVAQDNIANIMRDQAGNNDLHALPEYVDPLSHVNIVDYAKFYHDAKAFFDKSDLLRKLDPLYWLIGDKGYTNLESAIQGTFGIPLDVGDALLNYNTEYQFCAGYLNGGRDACDGDSGGAFVFHDGNTWRQAGIVSWAYGCGARYNPGLYTRVSKYIGWIEYYTGPLPQWNEVIVDNSVSSAKNNVFSLLNVARKRVLPRGTMVIRPGSYNETLTISRPMVLRNSGNEPVVIGTTSATLSFANQPPNDTETHSLFIPFVSHDAEPTVTHAAVAAETREPLITTYDNAIFLPLISNSS